MLRSSAVGKFTDNTNLGEAADTPEAGAAVQRDLVGWRNGLTMSLQSSTEASEITEASPALGMEQAWAAAQLGAGWLGSSVSGGSRGSNRQQVKHGSTAQPHSKEGQTADMKFCPQ